MTSRYLDNAATSYPKPPAVHEQMIETLKLAGGNPGRAGHRMARAAQQEIEKTRLKLARLVNAAAPSQIIFTFNATDALNMALKGLLEPGDEVITTRLEHNSVLRPLNRLSQTRQISIKLIDFDPCGFVSPEEIERAITTQTRLIALTVASNVLGTLQPIEAVGRIARSRDLIFLVDAAQALGTVPIDIEEAQIDLLASSGHKALLGPPGTGLLYVGPRARLNFWREGGTGGDSLSMLQPDSLPFSLEAGTPNTSGIAGLGAALDYLLTTGVDQIREHELSLTARLIDGLCTIPAVKIYGTKELKRRLGTVPFSVEGYRSDEVAAILDESFDIAVRGGLHCAPLVHQSLGTSPDGLVRASIGPFNSNEDIDALVSALKEIGS
jgi:cysteine desulfurase / selenocysteine lyase